MSRSPRERRARRQALDDGDADDIVWIKVGHSGTQHAASYHEGECSHVDEDPAELNGNDLHELRDRNEFGDWIPKRRAFERRGSKQPAACVLEADDGTIPCPDCPERFDLVEDAVAHWHAIHGDDQQAVAADGGDGS